MSSVPSSRATRMPRLQTLAIVLAAGCTSYSTRIVDDPARWRAAVGNDGSEEVRFISASGRSTGWLATSRLVIVGDAVCLRSSEPPWSRVSAVRVSQLTDSNIAATLVDLPRSIPVVHLGHGEVELETRGQDLTSWVTSVAHDPADAAVARYRVTAWQISLGPFTWRELARVGNPMFGWPIEGTTAELRHVDVARSILLSALAAPVVVAAAGIAVAARTPSPLLSDEPPRLRSEESGTRAADLPVVLVGAAIEAQGTDPHGTWSARLCNPSFEVQP